MTWSARPLPSDTIALSRRGIMAPMADDGVEVVPAVAIDRRRLADVCDRYGVAELHLFGSVARNTAGHESDIDLLYVLAPGHHLGFSINRLEDDLAELFGRPVDLVSKAALHAAIRDDVLAEAQELYAA